MSLEYVCARFLYIRMTAWSGSVATLQCGVTSYPQQVGVKGAVQSTLARLCTSHDTNLSLGAAIHQNK